MSYDKRFSDKAINYLERVKRTGIENRQELDELSRQAYSDYREGIPSEKEYGSIYAQVKMALSNTIATFTAYDKKQPIGMVRLIGDGGMSFYIKDFVVIPTYQAMGVGTLLIECLEKYIRDNIKHDWAVSLELISTKEALLFYKKKGFEERPCEWDGPGMFKMIRYNQEGGLLNDR